MDFGTCPSKYRSTKEGTEGTNDRALDRCFFPFSPSVKYTLARAAVERIGTVRW